MFALELPWSWGWSIIILLGIVDIRFGIGFIVPKIHFKFWDLYWRGYAFWCAQDKAQNALEDAGDSLKRNADKATSAAKDAGKDVQRKAEDAGDSARDTAHDLKRDAQKGADRISN